MIPPSIGFIKRRQRLHRKLFLAGIVPGVLMGLSIGICVVVGRQT